MPFFRKIIQKNTAPFYVPSFLSLLSLLITSSTLFSSRSVAGFQLKRSTHSNRQVHLQHRHPYPRPTVIYHKNEGASFVPARSILSSTLNSNLESIKSFFNSNRDNISEEVKSYTSDLVVDIDEEALGEYCSLITGDEDCLSEDNDNIDRGIVIGKLSIPAQLIDDAIKYIPFIAPVLAFFTYEEIVKIFDFVIELVANNNWKAVDGGVFSLQTLTPAINGIVLPTASILFATLSGTTITTLRQRQLDIRTCLNKEASEIRILQATVDCYPSSTTTEELDFQDKCRAYLIQYTARLITESQPEAVLSNLKNKGFMESEMNGFIVQLNEMATQPPSTAKSLPNPIILSESFGVISRLNSYRSERISALQSTFPALHFLIVFALGGSICLVFLMETDQKILIFLNAVQLRLLWSILIGTLTSLGTVCYDLSQPFRGSYQIASSIDQLYTIREVLRASDRLKKYKRLGNEYENEHIESSMNGESPSFFLEELENEYDNEHFENPMSGFP